MTLSRRGLLRLSGAAGALGASGSALALEEFFRPAGGFSAQATKVATCCGICSPACGLQATVENGAVRFVEGLPGDAHGEGHLCGKGAAGAQFLYDPDRLKYPMKRTNPNKGFDQDPGWVRISWQEALDTIAAKMQGAIDQHGTESLLFVTLPAPDLWARFMNAMGVVNRIDHIDVCFQTDRIVQRYTTGGKTWCNDFENSKYILLFGWDLVAKAKIVYANGIVKARSNGAKVVHFSPSYTATSRMASEWHNINPGTDLAVALAMIHVILRENLYNKEFVDSYTNFSAYESQIRTHFQEYTPQWAEEISAVPAAAIERIARELMASGGGIVPAHKKTLCANYMNATQLVHAISILNLLAGTVDRPGGRYFPRTINVPGVDGVYPPPAYPAKRGRRVDGRDKLPLVQETDTGLFSTLADGMLNKFPGMIKFAFWNAYTILAFPNPRKMEQAMAGVDFSVVMDFIPTDTVSMADIVLPSAMYLETSDVVVRDYNAKYPQAVARAAVAPPIFETRSAGYVAIELGKRLCPDYFKTPDGSWINPNVLLDEKVKRAGLGADFAEFRQKGIVERPAPFVPRTSFATGDANNKCQLYVPQFAARGADALPKWRPKREMPNAEFPLYFLTFIPGIHKRNTTQNNRLLNEIMPTNAAILNPALAAKLGIGEGQMVRVRSRVGQIELPAHLSQTVRPDAVLVAHGFGHRSRYLGAAGSKGVRDGDIVPDASIDDFVAAGNYGGASCIMDAVCAVEKLR
ncbi:MAG: molybdopterin-dependent oxidoreductase [Bryobacteraceae bacterium]|nr:molybdopterin-dependent oxidoreductase [Bryobacteraceae bacterium]